MKLTACFHQNIREKPIAPLKDLANFCTCFGAQSPINNRDCYPGAFMETGKRVEDTFKQEKSINSSKIFYGFLTIGTLGAEPIISEPPTPKFATPLGNITGKENEMKENHLKVKNDELGKFPEAEAGKAQNEPSGSNHISINNLSNRKMEGDGVQCEKAIMCPLQGYVSGSTTKFTEAVKELKTDKPSSPELLYNGKVTEVYSTEKCVKGDTRKNKKNNAGKNLIKRMLQKFYVSKSCASSPDAEAIESGATKEKLQKALKKFHKKVYPENSSAAKEPVKCKEIKINDNTYDIKGVVMHTNAGNRRCSLKLKSTDGIRGETNNIKLPVHGPDGCNSVASGEHWIKTDENYLVLELNWTN